MTSVVIGRKELFSFVERHTSQRLRDYAGLADGSVLAALFGVVFPALRIRPVSLQTHTVSQRAAAYWEALFRHFARLRIPLELLDPPALAANDAACGFSALVLFYFLHHLARQTDFSAEFALDVSDALTAYLQSVDSIASLLLGGAIDWAVVPPRVGERVRALPVFHCDDAEEARLEAQAVRLYRDRYAPPGTRRRRPLQSAAQRRIGGRDSGHSTGSSAATATTVSSVSSGDAAAAPPRGPAPQQQQQQPADAETHALLLAKTEELEEARGLLAAAAREAEELRRAAAAAGREAEATREELERLRRQHGELEAEHLRRRQQEAREGAAAPLADAQVQEVAGLLHCLLLERTRGRECEQAQAWLWALVGAARASEAAGERDRLLQAHRAEHRLRTAAAGLHGRAAARERWRRGREGEWRALCAALRRAEQASFALASSESEPDIDRLLRQRATHFAEVEAATEALVRDREPPALPPDADGGESEEEAVVDAVGRPCRAVELLLESALHEREALRRRVAELEEAQQWRSETASSAPPPPPRSLSTERPASRPSVPRRPPSRNSNYDRQKHLSWLLEDDETQ